MRVHIMNIEDEGPQPRGLSLGSVPTQGGSPWLQTPCFEENWLNLPSGGAPLILSSNLICGHVWLTVEKFLSTEVFHWVRVLSFDWFVHVMVVTGRSMYLTTVTTWAGWLDYQNMVSRVFYPQLKSFGLYQGGCTCHAQSFWNKALNFQTMILFLAIWMLNKIIVINGYNN